MITRIVVVLFTAMLVGGCGDGTADPGADATLVVAAFYPLAFAAEELAPAETEIENITPAGSEPHDVELSAREVERIRGADVVLYFGGGFQPALERAVEALDDGRAVDLLRDAEPFAGDPHVWLDPFRYSLVVESIGSALDNPRGARQFVRRLVVLDRDFHRGLRRCERRTIVTSHSAFTYLADRYGLKQVAVTGLAPEGEPTARELESVVDEVRRTDATTVFFEPLVSPKLAETVAREAGIETATLDPLEGLSEERLAAGADYFSVMRENLAALREALGCR
jgi:zinc transport system substrate-binding protein